MNNDGTPANVGSMEGLGVTSADRARTMWPVM